MVKMPMIRPVLASKDLDKTRKFYEAELNFKKVFQDPQDNNPTVIEMEYDGCKILFYRSEEATAFSGSLELFVSDIEKLHQEISKNGNKSSTVNDYYGGAKCIEIVDPNGYCLTFVEPIEKYKKFFGLGQTG